MSNLLNTGRQTRLIAEQAIDFQDLASGAAAAKVAMGMPIGAIVLGGGVIVETPWNSGTTATIAVGETGTPGKFATGLDLKTAGYKPLTGLGVASAGPAIFTLTEAGAAATAGKGRVIVEYMIIGRANEVQVS